MGRMKRVIVYTTANCPKCEKLKVGLRGREVMFTEMNMASADALTELRFNGVFTLNAPVLQVGEEFYTSDQLFNGDQFKQDLLGVL